MMANERRAIRWYHICPPNCPQAKFRGQIPSTNTNTQMAAKRFEIETRPQSDYSKQKAGYTMASLSTPNFPFWGQPHRDLENGPPHKSQTPCDRNTNSTALYLTKGGLSNSTTFAPLISPFEISPHRDLENGHARSGQTP